MTPFILFGCLILFLFTTVPISVSLGFSSLIIMLYGKVISPNYMASSLITSIDSFPLMAVPLFILAGELMSKVGISRLLLKAIGVFFGRFTGGLGLVTVIACMFFASISGSGPATVVAIGGIMIPEMIRLGYSREFAAGLVAVAGGIGIIIPPSIPMVFYGVGTETSITALFTAGFTPGILIGIGLMIMVGILAKRKGYHGDARVYTAREKLAVLNEAKFALVMPVIILGGIYGGIFTPTEAAGIAVIYSYAMGFVVYRNMRLADLYDALCRSAGSTVAALIIAGMAMSFARILTLEKIPGAIANGVLSFSTNPIVVMVLINVFLLIVGCFIDTVSAVIILAPILLPIAKAVGVHPVHFGLIMIVNLAIGFVTPPLGVNLFMACGISKLSLEKISVAVLPWMLVMLICLGLITYVPWITMFLPRLFMGTL